MRLGIRKAHERLEGMSTSLALARVELAARSEPVPRTREGIDAAHYVAFEERFRGSTDEIRGKLSDYVPYFRDAAPVADLGCGRGEFLDLLREAGIDGHGRRRKPRDGRSLPRSRDSRRSSVTSSSSFPAARPRPAAGSSPLSSWSTFPRAFSAASSKAAIARSVPEGGWCWRR